MVRQLEVLRATNLVPGDKFTMVCHLDVHVTVTCHIRFNEKLIRQL